MLMVVSVTVCLCVLAIGATAKVVGLATDRLGLDLMSVLLWFGLAEWPSERSSEQRSPRRLIRSAQRPRTPRARSGTGSARRPAHP